MILDQTDELVLSDEGWWTDKTQGQVLLCRDVLAELFDIPEDVKTIQLVAYDCPSKWRLPLKLTPTRPDLRTLLPMEVEFEGRRARLDLFLGLQALALHNLGHEKIYVEVLYT